MKGNYESSLSIESAYPHRGYDKDTLNPNLHNLIIYYTMEEKVCQYSKEYVKAFIHECLPFDDLISALEKCDYDLDRFFSEKHNDVIQDEGVYITLLTHFKQDLSDYFFDLANGYWNLPVGYGKLSDIARSLWNAHTDADIWDILLTLPASVACEVFHCYTGRAKIEGYYPVCLTNPDRAREMIEHLLYHKQNYLHGINDLL